MAHDKRTCFVSGHIDLTRDEFQQHYAPRLSEAIANKDCIVVGDAAGADSMAQAYLAVSRYGRQDPDGTVTVFHMLEAPRNCAATWFGLKGGYKTDEERDAAMTCASTVDIAWVRPGKSKRNSGTAKNLRRRERRSCELRQLERQEWPVFNVVPAEIGDDGTRSVRISPPGQGYGDDIRLPQSLVDQLVTARAAIAAAGAAALEVEQRIIYEFYSQMNDRTVG